ncbi:MAG TPA: hypothetical protein VHY20_08100, partial [Pirellulales bacterium]|nr:hypothetical protein [Pirellulales bacterium]
MKRRSIYGLLPLVLLVAWLGCKSSDPTTLGGAASIAAAPPAIPSTPSPATAAATPPASAANPTLPGAVQPPTNASAQNPARGPQQRNVELKEIMNE